MALETGDFIGDLDPANPPGADPKSQGDDHLRLIKNTLHGTFGLMLGLWELPTNGVWISQRNFADSAQINMIRVNPSDEVEIGAPALISGVLTVADKVTIAVNGLEIVRDQFKIGRAAAPTQFGTIDMLGGMRIHIEPAAGQFAVSIDGGVTDSFAITGSGDITIKDNRKLFFDGGSANAGQSSINYLDSISTWSINTRNTESISINNTRTRITTGNLEVAAGDLTVTTTGTDPGKFTNGTRTLFNYVDSQSSGVFNTAGALGEGLLLQASNNFSFLFNNGVISIQMDSSNDVSIPNGNLTVSGVGGIISPNGLILSGDGISGSLVGTRIDQAGSLISNTLTAGAFAIRCRLSGVDNFSVTSAGEVEAAGALTLTNIRQILSDITTDRITYGSGTAEQQGASMVLFGVNAAGSNNDVIFYASTIEKLHFFDATDIWDFSAAIESSGDITAFA